MAIEARRIVREATASSITSGADFFFKKPRFYLTHNRITLRSSLSGPATVEARREPAMLDRIFSPRPELFEFVDQFADDLGRRDRRFACALYLERLLKRKGRQKMHTGLPQFGTHARTMHQFVNCSRWHHDALLADIRQRLLARGAQPAAALVLGEFHVPRCGRHSVGVARHLSDWTNLNGGSLCWNIDRQRSMRGQLAVTWSWADSALRVPVATQLYLPPEWTVDHRRLDAAGVPEEVRGHADRWDTAFHLLTGIKSDLPPFQAVVLDEQYGSSLAFLLKLERRGIPYVAKAPEALSRHPLVPAELFRNPPPRGTTQWWARRGRFLEYRRALLHTQNHYRVDPLTYYDTDAPPRHLLTYWTEMTSLHGRARGFCANRWFILVPNSRDGLHVDCYVSNLPPTTGRAVFAELIYQLHAVKVEQRHLHRQLSAGHFEGRSWRGFHHHVVLSMLAWEFLKRHPEHAT